MLLDPEEYSMESRNIILITGGIRSGKSQYALRRARQIGGQKVFVATAQAFDEGMRKRIQRHKEQRGNDFRTIEEPLSLSKAIRDSKATADVIVIDCLTVWLNNLFHRTQGNQESLREQKELFLLALMAYSSTIIIVTNEIGLGVVPDNPLARGFTDALGTLNQQIARMSDEVIMMVCGIPSWVKGADEFKNNRDSLLTQIEEGGI